MSSLHLRAAVLALALPASAWAQNPVTLRVALREGQTARYRTVVETWTAVPGSGIDSTQPATVLTLYTTRTVPQVRGDTAILRDVIDSAVIALQGTTLADSAALRRAAGRLRGAVMVSAVDGRARLLGTAAGTVAESRVDPDMAAVLPMGGLLRGVFSLPEGPVNPGDTWRDGASGGDAGGSLTVSATYTLARTMKQHDHSVAVITAQGEMGGGGARGALSARFDGTISYDMDESQPLGFVVNINGTVAGRGGSVPIRIRRTIVRL